MYQRSDELKSRSIESLMAEMTLLSSMVNSLISVAPQTMCNEDMEIDLPTLKRIANQIHEASSTISSLSYDLYNSLSAKIEERNRASGPVDYNYEAQDFVGETITISKARYDKLSEVFADYMDSVGDDDNPF